MAVIDEQHRFGVDPRLLLGGKGELTDMLVMTATLIPRTLLLTQWGEMDVSRLTEKPQVRLLVATTVVEVGVDVPEASVMVIEHAERFGLAQLHQLRGRVGRGSEASFCLLLHEDWVNETARRRLTLLRDTEDGFVIADEDFRLRGGGDLLGTRQAGAPGFRLADPVEHEGLLHMADRDATVLLSRDPKLESERGRAVRVLLRLFERTVAMRTLLVG
jgi:ATP-dependent DNA helicase RecG